MPLTTPDGSACLRPGRVGLAAPGKLWWAFRPGFRRQPGSGRGGRTAWPAGAPLRPVGRRIGSSKASAASACWEARKAVVRLVGDIKGPPPTKPRPWTLVAERGRQKTLHGSTSPAPPKLGKRSASGRRSAPSCNPWQTRPSISRPYIYGPPVTVPTGGDSNQNQASHLRTSSPAATIEWFVADGYTPH